MNEQPNLFDAAESEPEIENILLYALGEFQSRGKILADRELPLDRLRGAFKRACEKYRIDEFSDDNLAENLSKIGARVKKVPSFVAKHPYKITVDNSLAIKAKNFYAEKTTEFEAGEKV